MELLVVAFLAVIVAVQSYLFYRQTKDTLMKLTEVVREKAMKDVISVPFAETSDGMARDPERVPLDELPDDEFMKAMKKSMNPLEETDSEEEKAKDDFLGG